MRNVKIQSGDEGNWTSLDINYEHDNKIKLNNNNVTSHDGISLNLNKSLSNNIDITNNNYSAMMLSDLSRVNDLFKLEIPTDIYPLQFTTSLVLDGFPSYSGDSKYVKILPRTDNSDTRDIIYGSATVNNVSYSSYYYDQNPDDDNSLYYCVTLIDDKTLTIKHNDNYATVFLTLDSTGAFTFKRVPYDIPGDDQKFNYIVNNTTGNLILLKTVDNLVKYIGSDGENLVTILPSVDEPNYPFKSIIKIIPYEKTTNDLRLPNNWVSYKTFGDQNNLNINESKSYKDIFSNFILSNQYVSITGSDMNIDIMQLKNQLTPSYESNRGNPFPNYIDCDHREYDKIFTGTNQIRGLTDMHLGYNSYSTDILLPVDRITYFHAPQDMYPYERININDSGLIEAGAVGGDSPIVSDKLFKKAADYKYNSPYGAPTDEETGVWLCTWLKSSIDSPWDSRATYSENISVSYKGSVYIALAENSNAKPSVSRLLWKELPDEKPVWVDRYYNPKHFSTQEALEFNDQYASYKSKFNHIISSLSADQVYVFDKLSDVTFEPGSLYAYYRVGPNENKITINSMSDKLLHHGQSPVYNQDRTTNINTTEAYTFTGDTYIETSTLNNTKNSDYTISFNLSVDDWTKPFGGQFLGNYTNHGVGFYNILHTTPYIIIPTSSNTSLYNTNMDLILTLPVSAIHVVHEIGNENINILTGDIGSYEIVQYDTTGMLVERTSLTEITTEVVSMNIDHNNIYILDVNDTIYKYDVNNELIDQIGFPYPDTIGRDINVSSDTYMDLFNEYEYRINCDTYTTDISGSVWFKKDDIVYKYTMSNNLGRAATYFNTINSIDVSLIAEQRINGMQGNNIILTGDNVSTLLELVNEWNNIYGGNMVRIVSGDDSKNLILSSSDNIQLLGGTNAGSPTTNIALSASAGDVIAGIKSDEDNNIWVLMNNNIESRVYKLDNDRNIIYTKSLSAIDTTLQYHMSGNAYMDIISEFNEGVYDNNIIIIHQDTTDTTSIKYTKLDIEGNLKSTTTKIIPHLSGINVNNLHNITNYETVKRICNDTINVNHIVFKTRLQSYFDTDKTYTHLIKYNTSNLTPGFHNFAAVFNSSTGNMSLFVDGDLQQAVVSDDRFTGAAYKYTKTIHNPLLVGTEPYFNNIILSEHLGIDGYSFISDCTIQNIRIYNDALNFHKIKALTRETKTIEDIFLTIPTGKRSYIDQVKGTYKHRTPGRKSTDFNIDIISNTLSSTEIQQQITAAVIQEVKADLPVNSSLNNINWIK